MNINISAFYHETRNRFNVNCEKLMNFKWAKIREKNVHALHLHQLQSVHHTLFSYSRRWCVYSLLKWTEPNKRCARVRLPWYTDQMRATNLFNYTLYLYNYYVNDGKSLPIPISFAAVFFLGCCTISSYIGILVYAICWLLHLWILFMCNTHCLFVQTLRQSGDFNDHICSLSGDLYAMVPAEHLLIGFSCKFSTENCCNVWMRWLSIQLYNRLNAHDCVCSYVFARAEINVLFEIHFDYYFCWI